MNYLVVDDAYLHHRLLVDDANILQPLGGFSYLLHEPPPSIYIIDAARLVGEDDRAVLLEILHNIEVGICCRIS